jgi:hypothetical protein
VTRRTPEVAAVARSRFLFFFVSAPLAAGGSPMARYAHTHSLSLSLSLARARARRSSVADPKCAARSMGRRGSPTHNVAREKKKNISTFFAAATAIVVVLARARARSSVASAVRARDRATRVVG